MLTHDCCTHDAKGNRRRSDLAGIGAGSAGFAAAIRAVELVAARRTGRLLGAQLLAPEAGDSIQTVALYATKLSCCAG